MQQFGQVVWSDEVLSRHNMAGPRYTSYPTALQFEENFESLLEPSIESLQAKHPISLYFHIPFCQNICYYCACNKIITKETSKAATYLTSLKKEAQYYADKIQSRPVTQIYFGGGTPTFLSQNQIEDFMVWLNQNFKITDNCEIAIEIDPRTIDVSILRGLRKMGFNRLSFGIQDTNIQVQQAVNRVQPFEQVEALVKSARELGFVSLNGDLIYGLPLQTLSSFQETIEVVVELQLDRLSVFNYAHLPHRFKPQRRIDAKQLPSVSEKLKILEYSIQQLTQKNYVYIGMDHFALPKDELAVAQKAGKLHRNFQGYTTQGNCALIGMGVSSISQVGNVYSQNHRTLETYMEAVENHKMAFWRGMTLTRDDEIRRSIIMKLICQFELNFSEIESAFSLSFQEVFSRELKDLQEFVADGLVEIDTSGIQVLLLGRLFIRSICRVFDQYFWQARDLQKQYSLVI
ncbi:MAG: oxygen-independent coproporphyrinogen III oxidase [Pseudomonadota bacterium]